MTERDALVAVSSPATLIQASSFRGPDGKPVGALDDGDVDRAVGIKPDLIVEQAMRPHGVHVADPRPYVRALEALAARCGLG